MLRFWPFFIFLFKPSYLFAEGWNFKNDPFYQFSKILETKLEYLPEASELSPLIGSNWIWPIKEGGALNRWGAKTSNKFSFPYFSSRELKNVDIAQLSPPEKFDLYLGNSNWTFSKFIEKSTKNLMDSDFKNQLAFSESILKFKNPNPLVFEGRSGLNIPFGSSDIKALLFTSILFQDSSKTKILGIPCKLSFKDSMEKKLSIDSLGCDGVNPGSFHILLTNFIGLRDEGIIIDLKRDNLTELRPVVGFVSNFKDIEGPISPSASKNTKREILVTTFIKFISPQMPKWIPGPIGSSRIYETFEYILELDKENNIIGGSWVSFNRPDYLVLSDLNLFQGKFKELEKIYKSSIQTINYENLKLNGLEQKTIIMEMMRNGKPSNLLNTMFEEYFENYRNHLLQKREIKKISRKRLSREIIISKSNLLKKINSIPIDAKLKKLTIDFVKIANGNGKDLEKKQQLFLTLARNNFRTFDLKNAGRLAYLQQKFIDDFIASKKQNYDRLDFIQSNFLMEPTLVNRGDILTANKLFLDKINDFFYGSHLEHDGLKANPTGELERNKKPIPTSPSSSPIVLSFLDDIKKNINNKKINNNKYWKAFLSKKKSIKKEDIKTLDNSNELKKYVSKRKNPELKRSYRLSFIIKRIQAIREVQQIPIFNTQKDKVDYYQQKFQEELSLIKVLDLFKPWSRSEAISLQKRPNFKDPISLKETSLFQAQTKKEIKDFSSLGNEFVKSIKSGNQKKFDEMLKNELLLNFETKDHLTPLLIAISEGQKDIIKKILSSKTNIYINYEDSLGKNALSLGISNKLDDEILKLLIDRGIDFNATDKLGKYPRDYLENGSSFDLYLSSLGAQKSKIEN